MNNSSDDKSKKALTNRLQECAPDKRLSCQEAWGIAEELGVTKKQVGQAADELKIKVHSCQLGCF